MTKIAYLQFDPQTRSQPQNIAFLIKKLGRIKNTLIILPELFLSSYYDFTPISSAELSDTLFPLLQLSRKNDLSLVGSLPIQEKKYLYNRSVYISEGKITGYKDKFNLYAHEKKQFRPGKNKTKIFKYKNIHFLSEICLDVMDPIIIRKLATKIQLLCVSSTVSVTYLRDITRTRSLENQIISIFANRSGFEKNGVQYLGQSAIFLPDGKTVPHQTKKGTHFRSWDLEKIPS